MMRKLRIMPIVFLLCMCLTGCGIQYLNPLNWPDLFTNAVEQMKQQSSSNSLKDTVAKNSVFPQNKATADAGVSAMKASDAAENSLKFNEKVRTIPLVGGVLGFAHGLWADHKVASAARKTDAYYTAVASDSTLQSAIKEAEGKTRVKGFSLADIPTWLLIIVGVLMLLLILALIKRAKKAPKQEPAPIQAPVSQPVVIQQPVVSTYNPTAMEKRDRVGTEEGQTKLLRKQCSKKGLDIDKVLAKFNNDVFAANEYIMSTPSEALEELK